MFIVGLDVTLNNFVYFVNETAKTYQLNTGFIGIYICLTFINGSEQNPVRAYNGFKSRRIYNMRRNLKKNIHVVCAFVTLLVLLATIPSKVRDIYELKCVLVWTERNISLLDITPGKLIFHNKKCPIRNCYITWDRAYFNISKFDVIVFYGPDIVSKRRLRFPNERYAHQSYIFVSDESSQNYKAPDTRFHGIFNFTWTYKLNSDISCKYMVIKNRDGKVIGPNTTIEWIIQDDMLPINDTLKTKLANKSIAAAWFVSNCVTVGKRELLAYKMEAELRKYNMTLDIYGTCGERIKYCHWKYQDICLKKLQKDYYFYFAFENSLSEDYVTEKLRNALQNYVVPIVYGGANYSRFMPDGIYLNARELNVATLVKEMVAIIGNKTRYYDFFKWHNHYSYHRPEESPDTDPFCSFCNFINNINHSKVSTLEDLYGWWNH